MSRKILPNEFADFRNGFTSLTYFEHLANIQTWRKAHCPEITDTHALEPFVQEERMNALGCSTLKVDQDIIAREVYGTTCRLQRSLEQHAEGRGHVLVGPNASLVAIVARLVQDVTNATYAVRAGDQFSTGQDIVNPSQSGLNFVALRDVEVEETDKLQYIFGYRNGSFTVNLRAANDISGSYYSPWSGNVSNGDCIYYGHGSVMPTGMSHVFEPAVAPSGFSVVREYRQGAYNTHYPAAVTLQNSALEFDCSDIFPAATDYTGAYMRVTHLPTGNYHDGYLIRRDGKNVVVDCSQLGQKDPSLSTTDYAIGCLWHPLPNVESEVGLYGTDGDVTFDLPFGLVRTFRRTEINGADGYFVRDRVIGVQSETQILPSIDRITLTGDKYVAFNAAQGDQITGEVLTNGDGEANQVFTLARENVFPDSIEFNVNGSPYDKVNHFADSDAADQVFVYKRTEFGEDAVQTGTGINGVRPPAAASVTASYRIGSNVNGNVGANTITQPHSGTGMIASCFNPKPAFGWGPREGSTRENFVVTRQRVLAVGGNPNQVGLTPDDIMSVVENYTTPEGTKPIARAAIVRQASSTGNLRIAIVPRGLGESMTFCKAPLANVIGSPELLLDVEQYLNGDEIAGVGGRLYYGGTAKLTYFVPRLIAFEADFMVTELIDRATIINAYRRYLMPEATDEAGLWLWRFPGVNAVDRDFIRAIPIRELPAVRRLYDFGGMRINDSAADVELEIHELPVLDPENCVIRQHVI